MNRKEELSKRWQYFDSVHLELSVEDLTAKMEIIQGFHRALGKIKNLNFALKANLHVKVKTLKLQQEQYGIFHRSTRHQFDRGEKTWIHGRSPLFATGQNVFREPSLRNRVERHRLIFQKVTPLKIEVSWITQRYKIYLVNKWLEGLLDWMRPNF